MASVSQSSELKAALAPGQVVGGRFQIEAEHRSDALGVIYRAVDQKTGRPVAVRLVASSVFGTPDAAQRLRDECRAIAKLNHRSLVATYGIGAVAGAQFLATEWADGVPLADYVRTREAHHEPLSLHGIYNIVAHVAKALERVHEASCHGAIWPGNVWVSPGGRVQVGDLGIARAALLVGGANAMGSGARPFLAPEIFDGSAPTGASDVYGLGSLLFYLLTRRAPGDGFIPPSMVHPEATPALDDAVLRCIERDPKQRFASVAEVHRVLHPIASGVQGDLNEDADLNLDIDVGDRMSKPPFSAAPGPTPPVARVDSLSGLDVDVGSVKPATAFEPARIAPPRVQAAGPGGPPGGSPFAPQGAAPPVAGGPSPESVSAVRPSKQPVGATTMALKDLVQQITENDGLRWMYVKDGIDHGPLTGRDLVQRIIKGEIAGQQVVANLETNQRGPLTSFHVFGPFLEQQKLHKKEAQELLALEKSQKVERRSRTFALVAGGLLVLLLGGGIFYFLEQRRAAEAGSGADDADDLFEGGEIAVEGGSKRRGGRGRRGLGGRTAGSSPGQDPAGGPAQSYEEAMNQAVNLGDVSTGGAMNQLSQGDIQGTMNRHIGGFDGCVRQELGRGAYLGKVTIDLAIRGDGSVSGVTVKPGSEAFQQCIQQKVRSIRFPTFSAPRMGARYSFDVN